MISLSTKNIRVWGITLLLLWLSSSMALAEKIAVLEVDIYGYQLYQAIKGLDLPEGIETRMFSVQELEDNPAATAYIADCAVVFVDVMMEQLADYMVDNDLMAGRFVYALNHGGDPKKLAEKGFLFDREIMRYGGRRVENTINMIRLAVHRHIDDSVTYAPPVKRKREGMLYHPEAPERFKDTAAYKKWNRSRSDCRPENPWLGILFSSDSLRAGQADATDKLIRKLEHAGFNVLPAVGWESRALSEVFKPVNGKPPVDILITFCMKFASTITDEVRQGLVDLNVPVVNVIRPYLESIDAWRQSEVGFGPFEVTWAVATPEFSGAIEPTPLIGKTQILDPDTGRRLMVHDTIDETVDHLIPRLKKWVTLQRKPNSEKKIAILYYNHSGGKQNIGAAYLNVFRSLQIILKRMKQEGYDVKHMDKITEEGIQELVLSSGRHVGSWAPGELEELLKSPDVERVTLAEYKTWFDTLPETFKQKVIQNWGPPEDCTVMAADGKLFIPMVKLGNLVLMPEPTRNAGGGGREDEVKMYHDPYTYPTHQYIAGYLWIAKKFGADAMVHLGTHATYEWLPGKQAGLAPSDPPEIMTGAIPNIYPYIMDDVGEGMQAKRRGRGVIIDHLTPPMKEADLYGEYGKLHDLFHKYEIAHANGSETAPEYMQNIRDIIEQTGIAKDLGLTEMNAEAMEEIHLYLHEIDTNSLPYGLHTFGNPYKPEAADETIQLIMKQNPDANSEKVRKDLNDSPVMEMGNFVRGLSGEYIPPGEGNDPLRNLPALPTGRNFYGFSPAKVPSKAAWEVGKKAAMQMIEAKLKKDGAYPQKVGVVLWAMETTRNEGVNESTILYLIGVEPVWDAMGRVKGSRVIPGSQLGRPRIDVLINPSGLYRDVFPDKLIFLDEAVQKAMVQTDIENLLSKNKAIIKKALMDAGIGEKEAEIQSRFRIFTEKVGSYGNGVSGRVHNSAMWDSDEAVSSTYLKRVQYAVGQGRWAVPVKAAFTENLRGVDIAVHSRSSNVIGIVDTDDFFEYLGGMSLAVKHVRGEAPETMVTMHRRKDEIMVEDVAKTIGREIRTRYLNPQWIQGMKQDNYAGAREMSEFVENLWGWQVTVSDAVDAAKWEQVYDVYVEDKYGQDLNAFFNQHNPWAYQSITARMLEAVRKDYWKPDEQTVNKLAAEYALNVIEKGVACCHHTCNNPMLNQMVLNIISLPGILSPEMAEQFKVAIEKMAQKPLEEQTAERQKLVARLAEMDRDAPGKSNDASAAQEPTEKTVQQKTGTAADQKASSEEVEGLKMEEINRQEDTSVLTSSGVQWAAILFVVLVLGLFVWGIRRRRQ
ncbi:cobalamin biosynthesis protein CobN [Desulfosarcina ovata subsp. sediminis]|uniref:Cobalamin biosynthesis protein CobN n=2 Tax=Desulfosarcina ovata TaxID=83564 RepID=A0A5K7ZQZ8_9BACT|nr:cobalamin biosynthesis protein CobN [Desulfosarcina ovata subsp. sediminis]